MRSPTDVIQRSLGNRVVRRIFGSPEHVQQTVAAGTRGASGRMPYGEQIQRLFGRFDIRGVRAHVGSHASASAEALNARAYASGDDVVFAEAPDLRTAAHEAAHIVQQRGGVQLEGVVGREGDRYERHADAVADLVVAGRSAEGLLSRFAGEPGPRRRAESPVVQRVLTYKGKQYGSMMELASDKAAFDAYQSCAEKDKSTKLKDKTHVYDLETSGLTEVVTTVTTSAPVVAPTLAPVLMSSLTGPSAQELRQIADAQEMTRIQNLVRAATVSFVGKRYGAHLETGGDGTAKLKGTLQVESLIGSANALDMSPSGVGEKGGVNIRLEYGKGLSIVFEFNEKNKTAAVFHVGPGG